MQNKVLTLVATHPFLSVQQIARELNIGERVAQQVIDEFIADEDVAAVNFRHPALRQKRMYYAVKHSSNKSHPKGISRMALAQAPAIATVYQSRNFLLAMRATGNLQWWDSYRRETYRFNHTGRRSESVLLHGIGIWKGIPFILEWDRGDISVRGIERRTRSLARFLGADRFAIPASVPVLVIVTTTWTRAVRYLDDFRRAAYAIDAAMPPVYAAALSDLRKHGWGTRTWLQMGTGIFRGYLFQKAGKRLTDIFPGDLAARRREIYLSLPEKFENESGARKMVALTLQTSPAEKQILRRIAGLPLATQKVIGVTTGLDAGTVKQGIKRLEVLGLVERIALEGDAYEPRYTHLTRTGLAYLAAAAGTTLKAYANDRNYRLDKYKEPRLEFLKRNANHLRAVYDTLLLFAEAANKARNLGWREYLAVWDGEVDARRHFSWQGRSFLLYPDGFGIYTVGHLKYPFFVEVERTVNRSRYAIEKKLKIYRGFMESGEAAQEFRRQDIYVLLIGRKRGQLERWRKAYNRVMGRNARGIHLRLSTLPEMKKQGATGQSWLDENKNRAFPFPGLASRPDSARMLKTLDLLELRRQVQAEKGDKKVK